MIERKEFLCGMRDAVPVGLGYLTVGFGVGIACQTADLDALQGFWISFLNNASAGEYAGLTVIAADAGLVQMILMMLVANARYLLMSTALSQKMSPAMPIWQRLVIGFDVTDEMFGLAISHPGYVNFSYFVGGMCTVMPTWSGGTVLGIVLGNLMPAQLASGFSVMLFGMFIAIIFPVAKKDRVVLGCIALSFASSWVFRMMPLFSSLSDGTVTILLTVAISAGAAWLFPHEEEVQ